MYISNVASFSFLALSSYISKSISLALYPPNLSSLHVTTSSQAWIQIYGIFPGPIVSLAYLPGGIIVSANSLGKPTTYSTSSP